MPTMRFTARWIEAVRVAERTDYVDADNPGLLLRVTPAGIKSWAYLYRRKGDQKRRMLTLGAFPDMSLKDARAKAGGLKEKIAAGADPAGKVQELKQVETVDELLDRYLKDARPPSAKWGGEVERIFRANVRPAIGRLKITAVKDTDVLTLLNVVKDRGSGIAANRTQAALRRAFNWAVGEKYLSTNPALGIAPRAKEQVRDRALAESEIRTFWTGLDSASMTPGVRLALRLALVTGQRIGEICGAEQGDVDLDNAMWTIPAKRSKNKREHSVPLSKLAVELLRGAGLVVRKQNLTTSPLIFPSRQGKPLDPHALAHAMRREMHHLGLDAAATPHDLRRTVASQMAAMGIGENIVARVLNHTSEIGKTITGRTYIKHAFTAEKRHALDAWAARLTDIVEGGASSNVLKLKA